MSQWQIDEPEKIRKLFKKLGQDEKDQYKSAVKTLIFSDNPRNNGQFKKSLRCYSYRLTSSFRILYDINFNKKIITILDIGDHKKVYGKD